jgi:hypothetical protein
MPQLCASNPFDGLTLVGPFADHEAAERWAESITIIGGSWSCMGSENFLESWEGFWFC